MWTVPNILTVGRLIAAPFVLLVFLLLPRPAADAAACAVFVLAALTDWLDGALARAWNQGSALGRMLDPIADKAIVAIALAALCGAYGLHWSVAAPTAVIILRETAVAGLREHMAGALSLPVTKAAKLKTAAQMLAIGLLLGAGAAGAAATALWAVGAGLLWLAAVLTAMTGWDYLARSVAHLRGAAGGEG